METDYTKTEIKLWPQGAPGSGELDIKETVKERSTDPQLLDRAISGVTEPSIIPMIPKKPNGTAVLIMPGGAYQRVVVDKEGYDIGQWLNDQGVTAFILKYRLPGEGHKQQYLVPLQDVQRAMRLIRANAAKYQINTDKIGVIGFSAGGHLASTIATKYDYQAYEPIDAIDDETAKPNFALLVYPVISLQGMIAHSGSRTELVGEKFTDELAELFSSEMHVTKDTPPTFLAHAHDDGVSSLNSIKFYTSLKENNVPGELHIFKDGGHGFGIRGAEGSVENWTMLAGEWMKSIGLF